MSIGNERSTSRREFFMDAGRVAAGAAFLAAVGPKIYAAEDNTIKVAIVGCGGRGGGAVANALSDKSGPIKLYAMADVFTDRLENCYNSLMAAAAAPKLGGTADSWVAGHRADQIDVPPERKFIGFDAYQKAMDCLGPGDVVILTTPVAFRWVHFGYAIKKGINVFMEKPVTVDGPTTRRMIQLAQQAGEKNIKVGVGLMCRHCKARWELYDRIRDGQIGDIITLRTYRQQGPAGFCGPRQGDTPELLWQIRNYLGFMWASGGLFQDISAHNIDECCWMKDEWPVQAQGAGSRCFRGNCVDQNFDHYDIEYTFADGARMFVYVRSMPDCRFEFASYAHGSKGSAVISTRIHTPAKCRIYKGQKFTKSNLVWAFPQPEPNPYETEWNDLVDAIRNDKPYNEAKRGAEASLVTAMGRKAVHTGQAVTFEEMLNCEHEFAPDLEKLAMDSPAPILADKDGKYPVPQPGILKDMEF